MKRILNIKIYVQLVACLFIITTVVYAQPFGPSPDEGGQGRNEILAQMKKQKLQLFHYLQLTDEQKEQLEANRIKYRKEVYVIQHEIKLKRDALRSELEKPQLDVKKVKDIHADLKVLYGKIEDIHLMGILGARQILNPEQFGRFIEFSANMAPHHPPIPK